MITVRVEVSDGPYDVHVGPGVRHDLGRMVAATTRARRVLVVTQAPIAEHWLDDVRAALVGAGIEVEVAQVADGEHAKAPAVLAGLWDTCARVGLERRDAVVALGGGVVGDLAGFVAATFNRGIDVVQVPTTVLSMVDASVGGKTGIDLPAGKNLVGAIHQPAVVATDTEVLSTLPQRVRREGFGEVVKHALIADPVLLADLEARAATIVADADGHDDLVARNVAIKARFVAADAHEHGVRAHLNLGHTYAHALEALTGYATWWHGEAVAVGTLVALALGEELGLHGPDLRTRVTELLGALGLPVAAPVLDRDAVLAVMARDKKADDGIRYVVLDEPGSPRVVSPTVDQVGRAIDRVESPDAVPPGDAHDHAVQGAGTDAEPPPDLHGRVADPATFSDPTPEDIP